MKKKIFSAALLFCTLLGYAQADSTVQSKPAKKLCFRSVTGIGLLEGETGTSFQAQTMAGVAWRSWFAGVGAGIDYYFFRSFPVFIDVRRNIFNGRKTPFVYADGGINFPWSGKVTENSGYNNDYKNGWYYDIGAGYSIQTKKSGTYLFSLGFSEKKYTEEMSYRFFGDAFIRDTEPVVSRYVYQLRRLTFKAGIKL